MDKPEKIVAVLHDLLFQVKIQEAAKRAGVNVVFARSESEVFDQVKTPTTLIILDLNDAAAKPLNIIERLKFDSQTKEIKLLGYVSHVQTDLIRSAREKGCDEVMARSAFVQNLPETLTPNQT